MHHISRKYLIPLVIAVLAVAYLAAASAYDIWPFGDPNIEPSTSSGSNSSLSEVEGWQTYRNEEFGFEVRIPLDWKLSQNSRKDYIEFTSNSDIDWNMLFLPGDLGIGPSQYDIGEKNINSINWIIMGDTDEKGAVVKYRTMVNNLNFGMFIVVEEDQKILDQILSTFRFIK